MNKKESRLLQNNIIIYKNNKKNLKKYKVTSDKQE
jgi:hypothetical protein